MIISSLKKYKLNSIFSKFFIAFLILIVVPVAVSNSIAYLNTRQLLKDEAEHNYALLLHNIRNTFDQGLDDLYQGILQVSKDEDVLYILSRDSTIEPEMHIPIIRVSKKLTNIKLAQGIIEDVFIYFKNIDKVFNDGLYSKERFFEDYFGGYNGEIWNKTHYFNIINTAPPMQEGKSVILNTVSSKAQMIVVLNKDKVANYFKGSEIINDGKVFVLNRSGDVIFTTDNRKDYIDIQRLILSAENHGSIINYREENYILKKLVGSHGLMYVSLVPESVVLAKANYMRDIIIRDCILMFITGVILSAVFSRWMYKPIQHVIHYIEQGKGPDVKKLSGELGFIKNNFRNLFDENKDLRTKVDEDIPILRERLAYLLLNGLIKNEDDLEEWNKKAGRIYLYDLFCVVCIRIESRPDLGESEFFMHKSLCMNSIKNLAEMTIDLAYTQLDENKVALIVNTPGQNENEILRFSECIKAILEKYLDKVYISIGIGINTEDILKVCDSYRKAEHALCYRQYNHEYQVIQYSQVVNENKSILYPLDRENMIINALVAGEYESAVNTFEEILNKNLDNNLPHFLVGKLFNEFFSTLQRAVYRVNNERKSIFTNITSFLPDINAFTDYKECMGRIYAICKEICNYVNDKNNEENLVKQIKLYIDENLHEDIHLEMLAAKFDFNASYFSKYFKDHFGINFLEYVNSARINRVKELLLDTEDNIQEIAVKTGFKSGNTLTRTFKKYEGILPSKYREICTISDS